MKRLNNWLVRTLRVPQPRRYPMTHRKEMNAGKPTVTATMTVLVIAFLFIGCSPLPRTKDKLTDFINKKEFWGGYEVGATYITQVPLVYAKDSLNTSFMWPLNSNVRSKVTLEEYQASPESYPGVELVQEGTQLHCTEIQYRQSFEYSMLEVIGVFATGPLEGRVVDFTWLHQRPWLSSEAKWEGNTIMIYEPNPELIKPETP